MNGILALQGGGPFAANDDLDRRVLAAADATRVVMMPTADAYEHPELLVAAALLWGERLGVEVEALMVMRRGEAMDESAVAVVRGARAVYLVGDQPLHLRSVLKATPLWEAITQVLADGGVVAATGGSAAAMCDPMVDPRGGAFTLGLGLIDGLALVTEAETWSADRLHRTLKLANTPVVELPSGAALLHTAEGWERIGDLVVHGELPRNLSSATRRDEGGSARSGRVRRTKLMPYRLYAAAFVGLLPVKLVLWNTYASAVLRRRLATD